MDKKKINIEQVKQVAKLARLNLSEAEIAQFSTQMSDILQYVEKLDRLDTANIEPLAHCLPVSNCLREDIVKPSLGTEKTLANAPDSDGQFFIVPKILDEAGGP
ncbi:MAG: Asp-tRNA(Asn)/Glu-tRNA(Gln) amidotransferase subunit GatC [Phycisphaerae bacterium]|nr:Asp-tRNA(Asn)/Glu-tRNA(Gln) amidotransferase subunit GatC [Phycisphaerae bacterium]